MSLRVSDGIGIGTPGRLTPLCERDDAADDDRRSGRGRHSTLVDAQPHEAVVDQHVVARLQHLADHRRADRQLAVRCELGRGDDDLLAARERDRLRRGRRSAASGPAGRRSARSAGRARASGRADERARARGARRACRARG